MRMLAFCQYYRWQGGLFVDVSWLHVEWEAGSPLLQLGNVLIEENLSRSLCSTSLSTDELIE